MRRWREGVRECGSVRCRRRGVVCFVAGAGGESACLACRGCMWLSGKGKAGLFTGLSTGTGDKVGRGLAVRR